MTSEFGRQMTVLENVTMHIPPGHYALLTRNSAIRRPFVNLVTGISAPMLGRIARHGSASWPIGRNSFAHRSLTGLDIIQMIATVYGLKMSICVRFLNEIMTEPDVLGERLQDWSSFSKLELCNSLALLPDFDIYVIDGNIDFSKGRFGDVWSSIFLSRVHGKTLIVSSYNAFTVLKYCNAALVASNGTLTVEPDLNQALIDCPISKSPTYRDACDPEADDDENEL